MSSWKNAYSVTSKSYVCGHCQNQVASGLGYMDTSTNHRFIRICPHCTLPSIFQSDEVIPGIAAGNFVDHLPDGIHQLYDEARNCASVNAHTAAVLACRKLLMNIAVEKEAKEGKSFFYYVEYLASEGYVPPNGKGWVDQIRKRGNEANHEIIIMDKDVATELISFAEMLLKFIFEFPAKVPSD